MPLQEVPRGRDEERQDERVRLGEVECALHVVLRRPRVAEHVVGEGIDDQGVYDREVEDRGSSAREHRREDIDSPMSVPLGQANRGERDSCVTVLTLGARRRGESRASRSHVTEPHERLYLKRASQRSPAGPARP